MAAVISDLNNNKIIIDNFKSCYNLLEILLANIVYNTKKNELVIYEAEDKEKILKYLHVYLRKKRPKRILRRMLSISSIFIFPRNYTRIFRFVNALHDILESEIYKNIINKEIEIQIKRNCKNNVHAELKLLDFYINDIFKNHDINKKSTLDNKDKFDVFIAPSRFPCAKCRYILQEVNLIPINSFRIITPQTKKKRRLFKFPLPSFLVDSTKNEYLKSILDKIPNNDDKTSKEEIKIQSNNSNKTDKKKLCLINSFYSVLDKNNHSVDYDSNLMKEIVSKVLPILDFIKTNIKDEKVITNFREKFNGN